MRVMFNNANFGFALCAGWPLAAEKDLNFVS